MIRAQLRIEEIKKEVRKLKDESLIDSEIEVINSQIITELKSELAQLEEGI